MTPEECKETLRPMAAQIYAAMYVADKTPTRDEDWKRKDRAHEAVLAASTICSVLNDIYGRED